MIAGTAMEYEEENQQLTLVEGFEIEGTRLKLTSATNIWTDKVLKYKQSVSFAGNGFVKGFQSKDEDGKLRMVWVIEVLDIVLD